MGHEAGRNAGELELQGEALRIAELHANIALTDIFTNGAAVSYEGVVKYPFLDTATLEPENRKLFEAGRIISIRPDEGAIDTSNSAYPPLIFAIPPRSLDRLALKRSFSRGREFQPSVMLYFGLDENNKPVTDSVTSNNRLMRCLRNASLSHLQQKGINIDSLGTKPTTIAKNALFTMAFEFGIGDMDEYVKKQAELISNEKRELIAEVENFLNGNK